MGRVKLVEISKKVERGRGEGVVLSSLNLPENASRQPQNLFNRKLLLNSVHLWPGLRRIFSDFKKRGEMRLHRMLLNEPVLERA
jgi:hypothetical protein